jgi:single-strand DNA-binding protein
MTDIPSPRHIKPRNQNLTIMKYGVNRVTLVGNVGDEPRVSEREGEAFVANFPLATNEFYRNKEGEEVSKTEWHRIVVWNKGAEIVKNHVKKGDALYVEGKITTNSWDDKEGNKHYSTEVICDNFLFLSPRNNGEEQKAD